MILQARGEKTINFFNFKINRTEIISVYVIPSVLGMYF